MNNFSFDNHRASNDDDGSTRIMLGLNDSVDAASASVRMNNSIIVGGSTTLNSQYES